MKYLCLAYYDPEKFAALHPVALFGEQVGWGIDVRPIEHLEQ